MKIVNLSSEIDLQAVLTVSGGSLDQKELIKLRTLFPNVRWIKTYGQTETFRSLAQCNQFKFTSSELETTINGVKVFLLDDKFNKVEAGEIGRLYHFSQEQMCGYLGDTEDSLVTIFDNGKKYECIDTGDYFKRLGEESFEYVGRKDDMIKYSGRRFYANEIEKIINLSPKVMNSFAFCTINNNHSIKHEKLVVAIETQHSSVDELKSLCVKNLEHYKIPDEFVFFESFPISISGKIDKRKIKERILMMNEAKNGIA